MLSFGRYGAPRPALAAARRTHEACERFCVLGPPEAHVEKLRRREAAGVDRWTICLMASGQDETLAAYGQSVIPALSG